MTHPFPIHIAIAEDEAFLRELIVEKLNDDARFKVFISAGNGKELIDQIDRSYIPDICVMDITMPVMSGYTAVYLLRKKYPSIKNIAFSSVSNDISILRMFEAGALGFISKNEHIEDFKNGILEVFHKGAYFSKYVLGQFPEIEPSNMDKLLYGMFTEKELLFLNLCATAKTYEEIAVDMNIGKRTAEGYAENIKKKLNISSRVGLAVYAVRANLSSFLPDVHFQSVLPSPST